MKIIKLIFICAINTLFGQNNISNYKSNISIADSLYKVHKYFDAAKKYHETFNLNGNKGFLNDRYNAAKCWALANYADSSFFNLQKLSEIKCYLINRHIEKDSSFKALQNTTKWVHLINTIYNDTLVVNCKLKFIIDSMAYEDQTRRMDHLNYPILSKIFKLYGFLDNDFVGEETCNNFCLLVLHQDAHLSFQDSVLKLLKIAYDNNKTNGKNYAYLLDRVNCNKGELQIYGTQVNWKNNYPEPKPVIEPSKLNERRKAINLSTEEEYLELMLKHYLKDKH